MTINASALLYSINTKGRTMICMFYFHTVIELDLSQGGWLIFGVGTGKLGCPALRIRVGKYDPTSTRAALVYESAA